MHIIGKTKKELQVLLQAYQQAVDVNIICSMTDPQGTIIYVNKMFCEISKYSEKELLGQNHRILNSGFHPKNFFIQMWKTMGKGDPWHSEIKNKAKDGTFYWVDTVILPILDKTGKIIQYFSLRMLINDRKQAEEEKANRSKEVEEMLFMTSHEVRKPIASCIGLMNLVENDSHLSQEELWKIVRHLKLSALELDDFTKKLTSFMHEIRQRTN